MSSPTLPTSKLADVFAFPRPAEVYVLLMRRLVAPRSDSLHSDIKMPPEEVENLIKGFYT